MNSKESAVNNRENEPAYREAERLVENPPADRYCDLVLTGGVASGVVYPWAIVELARHYRFRSIGGTSVGAVAAAIAAASEFGRRNNLPYPFEVLRQVPLELAKEDESGRTKMLRLFQPVKAGQRIFSIFVYAIELSNSTKQSNPPRNAQQFRKGAEHENTRHEGTKQQSKKQALTLDDLGGRREVFQVVKFAINTYLGDVLARTARNGYFLLTLLFCLAMGLAAYVTLPNSGWLFIGFWLTTALFTVVFLVTLIGSFGGILLEEIRDGFAKNLYGACTGTSQKTDAKGKPEQGFTDWLHEGIQRAAGFKINDRPLTFLDLWHAPIVNATATKQSDSDPNRIVAPPDRSIDLQVFSSNITFGVPVRFPLVDTNTRYFFDPQEWLILFPSTVIDYLKKVAKPYRPLGPSEPELACFERDPVTQKPLPDETAARLLELPTTQLPIVVAARMSMSFPILFSAIPVYAIDFEERPEKRVIKKCFFSDGGICSNFPIHLFDSPVPAWPTFGLYLDRRIEAYKDSSIQLPTHHLEGSANFWNRFVPDIERHTRQDGSKTPWQGLQGCIGLLLGVVSTSKDWADRVHLLMPQTRTRVVRLALKQGEGQLNIAMTRSTILRMAYQYGTRAGKKLADNFVEKNGVLTTPWKEHLYIRSTILIKTLREYLNGTALAVANNSHSGPIDRLSAQWTSLNPKDRALTLDATAGNNPQSDPSGAAMTPIQRQHFQAALDAIIVLEQSLGPQIDELPYKPQPASSIKIRSAAS